MQSTELMSNGQLAILIVDDDLLVRNALRRALRRFEPHLLTLTAESCGEARRQYRTSAHLAAVILALSAELPRQKPGDGCVPPLLCMGITGQVPAAESRPMRCTQPCKTDQDCDADGGGPLTGRCHPRTPGDVPIPAYCEIAP